MELTDQYRSPFALSMRSSSPSTWAAFRSLSEDSPQLRIVFTLIDMVYPDMSIVARTCQSRKWKALEEYQLTFGDYLAVDIDAVDPCRKDTHIRVNRALDRAESSHFFA